MTDTIRMREAMVREAQEGVERASEAVNKANAEYVKACKRLGKAKLELSRARGHPWSGKTVFKLDKAGLADGRKVLADKLIKGIVRFKEHGDPDLGNPHIQPGSWYVQSLDGKRAYAISENDDWQLELI